MNKVHSRTYWENYPSDVSPLNERNLNNIEVSVDEIDNRVITLDTTKLDKVTAATMVKDVFYDESTGIFTVKYLNGATYFLDTKLEKLAVNFSYNASEQKLIITLDDGTVQNVDLSALITQYEFLNTDTVAFSINSVGKVSAIVKDGSITEDKLQPNYLADIKIEVSKAQNSATAAATSEKNAKASETAAKESETNAKASETAAKISETNAKSSETAAKSSETNAATSETNAKTSEDNAKTSETNAASSATAAEKSNANAAKSETSAENSATSAEESADLAKSYAVGTDGEVRENDSTDNAKYYYEQAKHISQGMNGLIPMGTVTFENLPTDDIIKNAMYNISNDFTSDDRFLDGGGIVYGAGNNVYYTVNGKWDVLAASAVTGVKGNKETTYRQGNINITPDDIGALATSAVINNNTVTEAGYALDARQANPNVSGSLGAQINLLNRGLIEHKTSGDHDSRYLQKSAVINSNTVTEAGYALDARQANPNVDGSLAKQISALNDGLKNYLPLSGGKITASIFGSAGGQFAVDGNVYIKGNRYDGWLTDYLNLRPKVIFESVVHENTNAILETNSMYLLFSMTDISGEEHNPYVAFIYTGKTHINRIDIVGSPNGWASLPTNGGTIQGLYPANGAYNHVVIIKLYPL